MKKQILLLSMLLISMFLVGSVAAQCNLNLPASQVNMVAVDGTISYFDITLSSVPAGYDVSNGDYLGWCIDRSVTHPRGDTFAVMLYSSCNPPSDPSLDGYEWDKVNYILNNKDSATVDEIQQAIWNYVNLEGPYSPTLPGAQAIVSDAELTGSGFEPGPGDIVAVILIPDSALAQATIIELQLPELEGGGKVTGGGQIQIGDSRKEVGSFGFNAMWFSRNLVPNGEIEFVNHVTGDKVHAHPLDFLIVYTPNEGNKPWPMLEAYFTGTCTVNHEDGFTFLVYIRDNAEPKNPDYFSIEVRDGSNNIVSQVSFAGDLLTGNIQIHKPPK